MKETLEKVWNFFGMFVVTVLLAAVIFGIKGCISNDRDKAAACMAVGGAVSYNRCVISIDKAPVENWRK